MDFPFLHFYISTSKKVHPQILSFPFPFSFGSFGKSISTFLHFYIDIRTRDKGGWSLLNSKRIYLLMWHLPEKGCQLFWLLKFYVDWESACQNLELSPYGCRNVEMDFPFLHFYIQKSTPPNFEFSFSIFLWKLWKVHFYISTFLHRYKDKG